MLPEIIEQHSEAEVKVSGIVRRIINHLPPETLDGLQEIVIADRNSKRDAFGCYLRAEKRKDAHDAALHSHLSTLALGPGSTDGEHDEQRIGRT
jgi:hypothetical protein